MKLALVLTLLTLSVSSFAQNRPNNNQGHGQQGQGQGQGGRNNQPSRPVLTGCENLAQKAAEAISKLNLSNRPDSVRSDVFLIEKKREELIFDVQVGGRVSDPYFKVTIKKDDRSGACKISNVFQDGGRG